MTVPREPGVYTLIFGDTAILYTLTYAPRKTQAIRVHPDQRVTVKAPVGSNFAAVETFLRRRAPWILRKQAELAAAPPQPPPCRYVSGETFLKKTRWGSCTSKGKITLNLELMRAPKPCIDYVIVHELCHLVEHNHGKGFYALLDKVMPDWPTRRARLNAVELV